MGGPHTEDMDYNNIHGDANVPGFPNGAKHYFTADEALSAARGKTHGDFSENARVAMILRDTARSAHGWSSLSRERQLAYEEIILKIARGVSGATEEGILESFTDIKGYAELGRRHP